MNRANFIPAPHYYNLNMACTPIADAFGPCVYLVGSSIERRDFRDVDVRAILDDEAFAKLFPALIGTSGRATGNATYCALWSVMCSSLSLYLSKHSDLPVDFQIQQRTRANLDYSGPRHALGLFFHDHPADVEPAP
jgi:hypothetical protein